MVVVAASSTLADLEDIPSGDTELQIDEELQKPAPKTLAAEQIKPPTNRVFITHGKNKDIVAQIKELLRFGNFEPVVSIRTVLQG